MLIQMAWRNVWRNKTRSLVIITAVVIGLWGGIFSDAFMQGMSDQQIYSSIHTETGHLQINEPGFLLNHDMQLHIDKADRMLSVVKKIPEVQAAAASIQLPAMAATATSSTGIIVNGVDPLELSQVSDLSSLLAQGDYFEKGGKNQVVIGKQLAEKLKVKLHSRIILTLQTIDGDIIYGAFKVVGIFRSHDSDYDKEMIFVRKKDLRSLINFPEDAASIVTVLLYKNDDTEKVAALVKNEFPNKQVQTWIQLSPMLQLLSGSMMQMTIIFVGIILIALAFGIINTMLMAVMDRTREIGMLLSVGMKPSKVFRMIMLETIFLCLTGAVVGVLISMATVYWFGKTGINLSIIAEGINALGYSSVVYPALRADFYGILSAMVIVIAIVVGIFPARKAIRLRPAEALRGD